MLVSKLFSYVGIFVKMRIEIFYCVVSVMGLKLYEFLYVSF